MAKMSSIGRLFATDSRTVSAIAATETDVSAPSLLEMQERYLPTQSRRRRFALPTGEAHGTHAPALMSTMHPGTPLDRGGDLRALASRDFARALVSRQARRGGDQAQAWAQIQI